MNYQVETEERVINNLRTVVDRAKTGHLSTDDVDLADNYRFELKKTFGFTVDDLVDTHYSSVKGVKIEEIDPRIMIVHMLPDGKKRSVRNNDQLSPYEYTLNHKHFIEKALYLRPGLSCVGITNLATQTDRYGGGCGILLGKGEIIQAAPFDLVSKVRGNRKIYGRTIDQDRPLSERIMNCVLRKAPNTHNELIVRPGWEPTGIICDENFTGDLKDLKKYGLPIHEFYKDRLLN